MSNLNYDIRFPIDTFFAATIVAESTFQANLLYIGYHWSLQGNLSMLQFSYTNAVVFAC